MRRLIALVCVLVVFDLTLWSAIVPLLPYYRHELGLSTLQTAWMLAAFSLAVIVVSVPVGHLADRVGARLVTAIGTLLMAGATAGLALASSFPELLVARLLQGAADATVWGAGLAWVAARAPVERRGEAVGYAQVAATVGVIAGPFVGGVVTTTLRDPADVPGDDGALRGPPRPDRARARRPHRGPPADEHGPRAACLPRASR